MKQILTFSLLIFTSIFIWAQTPESISYQALIRDTSGQLLDNQGVGVQISILQGAQIGTPVYVEVHSAKTNDNGLLTLEIGRGMVKSGNFSTIDWSNGPYYIKTEIDPTVLGGTNYTIIGTSELLSVPYAFHAKTADSIIGGVYQTLSLNGNILSLTNGGSVNLSGYVNTDDQQLSLSGDTLSLTNGGSVDLTSAIAFTAWSLTGNNVTSSDFLGTTNNVD